MNEATPTPPINNNNNGIIIAYCLGKKNWLMILESLTKGKMNTHVE